MGAHPGDLADVVDLVDEGLEHGDAEPGLHLDEDLVRRGVDAVEDDVDRARARWGPRRRRVLLLPRPVTDDGERHEHDGGPDREPGGQADQRGDETEDQREEGVRHVGCRERRAAQPDEGEHAEEAERGARTERLAGDGDEGREEAHVEDEQREHHPAVRAVAPVGDPDEDTHRGEVDEQVGRDGTDVRRRDGRRQRGDVRRCSCHGPVQGRRHRHADHLRASPVVPADPVRRHRPPPRAPLPPTI